MSGLQYLISFRISFVGALKNSIDENIHFKNAVTGADQMDKHKHRKKDRVERCMESKIDRVENRAERCDNNDDDSYDINIADKTKKN